jgi:hypothetical protein
LEIGDWKFARRSVVPARFSLNLKFQISNFQLQIYWPLAGGRRTGVAAGLVLSMGGASISGGAAGGLAARCGAGAGKTLGGAAGGGVAAGAFAVGGRAGAETGAAGNLGLPEAFLARSDSRVCCRHSSFGT